MVKRLKRRIVWFTWLVVIVLGIVVVVNYRHIITGYTVYRQLQAANFTMDNLNTELNRYKSELTYCQSNLSNLTEVYETAKQRINSLTTELSELRAKLDNFENAKRAEIKKLNLSWEEKIGELNTKLDKYELELRDIQNDYDDLARNTANSICCKQKIDNPEIKYYEIKNDRILCTLNSGKQLKCPFD